MKKLILIFVAIISLALLSSCIKIYMPENPSDSSNTQVDTDTQVDIKDDDKTQNNELEITRISANKNVYQSYNLGKYYGSGFNTELPTPLGKAEYEIIQTYEELKKVIGEEAALSHPARYALAEVVNIHDDALQFEPIYRVVFGVDPAVVLSELTDYVASLHGSAAPQSVTYVSADKEGVLTIPSPAQQLTVGTLQSFLSDFSARHPEAEVDYIHGEDSLRALAQKPNAIGFLFDGMRKDELFSAVIFDGALPRKTFSMGHAADKRYYLECRRIK